MVLFLIHWLVVALGLGAAAYLVPGVTISSGTALALGALVLGFVNAVIRPVMTLLTLPLTIVTLGLFYFVVNAAAFALAAALVPGFSVGSFGAALLGALVVSLVSWFVGVFVGAGR
ncbi:MAG TPA: phage holin family protein [Vicinamibacterales bacterium]|nr:phage holin family protein [Vicinamibacterales bacterium]